MHVAQVVLSLDVGGLERNVINQVREGQALGQSVSVICLERPGILAEQAEASGGRLISLEKSPGIRLSVFRQLRAILRDLSPDIVHTHQIGTLFYAGPAVASLGRVRTKVVHTEHGREPYTTSARRRWLGRLAGLYAERFFCLTRDMAEAVTAARIIPREKVHLIHNGIDLSNFRRSHDRSTVRRLLGIPDNAPVIGTVGRLTPVKEQGLLIRAFFEVSRQIPAAHLVLVGDGPLLEDLQAQARRLGVEDRVHFTGYQPDSAPYLQAFDVFALTSRSEGMPQSALEASVCAVPVVAPRVGGLPELIEPGRTGVLFDPGDKEALVSALVELLADPARARDLGAAGQAKVESLYDVGRMAREYHEHFTALLKRRNAQNVAPIADD